jgi:hypothetical protein
MQRFLILLFFSFFVFGVKAQDSTKYRKLSLAVFDNVSALPHQGFGSVFRSPIHPGLVVGTEFSLRQRTKSEWYQTMKLGYFYHAHVQHAAQLYSETGYRYTHTSGLGAYIQLGAGYVHSFADQEVYVWKDGVYKKKSLYGRAQFMLTLSPGIHYDFSKKGKTPLSVFFTYQPWFQFPYVKKYITILPNASFQLGVIAKLKRK